LQHCRPNPRPEIVSMKKNNKVKEIVDQIRAAFHPQKIVLFGSYAWGEPAEDSDIDLFLVMDSDLRRDERARQVQEIFSDRTFPLDIIVYTPKELEESLARENPFIKEILSKGVLHG
jgi:uncharacterized protein